MTFLAPITAGVAAGILIPALVLLYFLKLRRQIVEVSSTLLWRKAIQDMEVNAPFQRLRRNLLLLLQLLILLALLLALARPTFQAAGKAGQRMAIVIDRSASMNATDAAPSRLEAAKTAAEKLVDDLATTAPGGAMVVAFAQRTQVVQPFTTDAGLLRAAIRAIEPTDESTRLEPALRLLEPVANQPDAPPLELYILSDGRTQAEAELKLGNAQVHFVQIGGQTGAQGGAGVAASPGAGAVDNVAITGLAARRDFRKPEAVQILVSLANCGPTRVDLNLTLHVDGSAQRVLRTFVPAVSPAGDLGSQSAQFDLTLPAGASIEVSHDHLDQLRADDRAGLIIAEPRQLRVLMVSTGNGFLEQAIKAAGVRRVVAMSPGDYERKDPQLLRRGGWDASAIGAEGFDVIVFDRFSPRSLPTVDSLFFAATPAVPGLKILPPAAAGGLSSQPVLDWRRDHPLMRYVEMQDVTIESPARLALPDGAEVLATSQAGPVMGLMTVDGLRFVFTSFDLNQARTWPMQVSFPVFVSNALPWLGLGGQADAGRGYRPGEAAVVTAGGGDVAYAGPEKIKAPVLQGKAILPPFPRAGVYTIERGRVAAGAERLPVNLLDALESDIRPAPDLRIAGQNVGASDAATTTRREVWRWFAWAALAVLVIEWVIYTRRMHI